MVSKLTRLVAVAFNYNDHLTTRFIFTHEKDKARNAKCGNIHSHKASKQKEVWVVE